MNPHHYFRRFVNTSTLRKSISNWVVKGNSSQNRNIRKIINSMPFKWSRINSRTFSKASLLEFIAVNFFTIIAVFQFIKARRERQYPLHKTRKEMESCEAQILKHERKPNLLQLSRSHENGNIFSELDIDFETSFFVKMSDEKVFTPSTQRRLITGSVTQNS